MRPETTSQKAGTWSSLQHILLLHDNAALRWRLEQWNSIIVEKKWLWLAGLSSQHGNHRASSQACFNHQGLPYQRVQEPARGHWRICVAAQRLLWMCKRNMPGSGYRSVLHPCRLAVSAYLILSYIAYCMNLIQMLQYYNIKPVLVFDGGPLPSKSSTEEDRRE